MRSGSSSSRRVVVLAAITVVGFVLAMSLEAPPEALDGPDGSVRGPQHAPDPRSTLLGDTLLVWTSGGLPSDLAAGVGELPGVEAVSVTRGDRVDLAGSWDAGGDPVDELNGDWVIPLEGFAVEPGSFAAFVPADQREALGQVGPGRALLSETSAELRRLGVGGVLEVGGERLTVAGVVEDRWVGAAEVVVDLETGARIGIERERFVLVRHDREEAALEREIRALLPEDEPARITPLRALATVRQGSGVLPQSHVKARFGEFALRDLGTRRFEQDPTWVAENISTEPVPILGRITCHREFFPAIRGALAELDRRGLAHLVRFDGYGGCWTPRFSGARRSVSRHAWGITADFNIERNPYGAEPDQDPRLVEVMESWGMGWGGDWLVPDAMHFEHIEFPED